MLIGGQHVAAAAKSLYSKVVSSGVQPPDTLANVRAIVLQPHAPVRICMMAAGFHQGIQGNVTEVKVVSVLKSVLEACKQHLDEYGDALLSDEQLWSLLVSHGLHVSPKERTSLSLSEINADNVTKKIHNRVCIS